MKYKYSIYLVFTKKKKEKKKKEKEKNEYLFLNTFRLHHFWYNKLELEVLLNSQNHN